MSRTQAPLQPGGPHGPLERRPLEDRHLRLARVRPRRLRPRRRRRHEEHRPEHVRAGPVGPHGPDPRRRLQAARRRERPVQSRSLRAGDPAFDAAVARRRRARLEAGGRPERPLAARPGNAARSRRTGTRRSSSSRSAATRTRPSTGSSPVLDSVAAAQRAHPGFFIGEFGDASAVEGASRRRTANDLGKAGAALAPDHADHPRGRVRRARGRGHPAAARADRRVRDLRADRAAQPPPAGGAAGPRDGAADRARGRRRLLDVLPAARARRSGPPGAARAPRSRPPRRPPGRSVLVSGLTVMVAMAGMFLTGDATFASLGLATILVVAVAVLGSLTVLPALLSKLGDRVDRLRVPLVGRLRRDDGEGRIWGAIVDRVLRRPVLSAGPRRPGCCWRSPRRRSSCAWRTPGPDSFPKSLAGRQDLRPHAAGVPRHGAAGQRRRQGAERERAGRARGDRPARAAGARERPRVRADHRRRERATPRSRTSPSRSPATGTDAASNASLAALRDEIVPQTVGALPNAEAGVTGLTAEWKDQADELKSKLPPVVAFVLAVRVRADAGRVPLARDRGQGDPAQPALGRPPPTACWCSSSSTASARGCSASARPPASTRSCRCCCS